MKKENWKIINQQPEYMISSLGNIKKNNGLPVRTFINSRGYVLVVLNKKFYRVHRLVAQSFIPVEKDKEFVNHKDGNTTNNDVSNLEWVSHCDNILHSYRVLGRKNNKRPVEKLRLGIVVDEFESISTCSSNAGKTRSYMRDCILRGKNIGACTYRYKEELMGKTRYEYLMDKKNECIHKAKECQEAGDTALEEFFKNAALGFETKARNLTIEEGKQCYTN